MVDAIAHVDFPADWKASIAGPVHPSALLSQLEAHPGWARVQFHGQISPPEVTRLLETARVGLVLLQRHQAYVDSLPTKMFEYFAAGLPVIASDFPLWREIIERYDCGLLVDETDPGNIAQAVRRYASESSLLERHGANAAKASLSDLNWANEEVQLLLAYSRVLAGY